MRKLSQDVPYAIRTLIKTPGVTIAIIISIALGIAANTIVFSVVNGLFFGALPVRQPERLVTSSSGDSFSYPNYVDYRQQTTQVFEGVCAHFPFIPASIGKAGEPERVWGELVSGDCFSIMGVTPTLGRGILLAEDEVVGRDAVVVLSYGLWRRRFGADPGIVGRTVALNGQRYTVVGVAPAGFHGTLRGVSPEFWAPLAMVDQLSPDIAKEKPRENRNDSWLLLDARLKPGVSRTQAAAALNVVKDRIDNTYHKEDKHHSPPITLQISGGLFSDVSDAATGLTAILMVMVGFVLLVACANVANLLLARATARQKEIAIRLAVGASRRTLIRQLLTESLMLALGGAAGGFLLAALATRALSRFEFPFPIPAAFDFNVDRRVLGFTAGLTILTAVLFGLAPALCATRLDLVSALKSESTIFGRFRRFSLRNVLVVVQVALSLALLVGAGLFLRSLLRASSIDLGMRPENVLLMAFDPKLQQYSRDRTRQLLTQLRERVTALPGVRSVSYLDSVPLSIGGTSFDFTIPGGKDSAQQSANANVYNVGSAFFETMGIPLLRGRDFDLKTDDEHVAIVNETFVRRLFAGQDPLRRQMSGGWPEKISYTVIGVARDSKSRTLGEAPTPCVYLSLEGNPVNVTSFYGISILAKTNGNPRGVARQVREQIATLDPDMAVFNIETMQEHVDKSLWAPRTCATLLGVFGAVGLTLAAIGLYGVMSYAVRCRTREIGIRMALGAPPASVLRMVLTQGLGLTAVGLVIGLSLALVLGHFAASLLYGISGRDRVTFITVCAVLVTTAFFSSVLPARRASQVEPTSALYCE